MNEWGLPFSDQIFCINTQKYKKNNNNSESKPTGFSREQGSRKDIEKQI